MAGTSAWRTFKAMTTVTLCLILLFAALPTYAAAKTENGPARRTVRVGIPVVTENNTTNKESRMVAFEKDYLQAVAEYANWDYTYVEEPWATCLEMERNGELDILFYVTKTEQREKEFDFSAESMGTELTYLFARNDTTLQYDDFAHFDGMTVGYEIGGAVIDSLREYGKNEGFSFTEKGYQTAAEMFAALDRGEVDTVAETSYFDTPEKYMVLAKCSPTPVYIVTRKSDGTLKANLDKAMAQLFSYNPGFNAGLYEYHFGGAVTQSAAYTQQEAAYLAAKPVVNVYYETDWAPFEYFIR